MISHSTSATDEYRDKTDHARHGQKCEPEIDRLERIRHVDGARVGAECIEQRVFDDDGEAERHQQHVAVIAMRRRADDEALQGIAEREEYRREQEHGDVRIEPQQAIGEESGEQGRGQHRAMREIDDVQHAVDQRQPERDQRIDRAGQQTVEDRGDQDDGRQHGRDTLKAMAAGGAFDAPPATAMTLTPASGTPASRMRRPPAGSP